MDEAVQSVEQFQAAVDDLNGSHVSDLRSFPKKYHVLYYCFIF
eukprot:SAG11_NODE_38022_length_254_cov_0.670968_1_plen_42_part_01